MRLLSGSNADDEVLLSMREPDVHVKHSFGHPISSDAPFRRAGCDVRDDIRLQLRTGFAGEKLTLVERELDFPAVVP